MAWSNSKWFQQVHADMWTNVAAIDLDSDTITNALYNNSITPDQTVTAANSAYNVAQWATAQEVFSAGQWAQGGVNLASKTVVASAGVITFDAADTASGATATLASVYGCLIYENTLTTPVADQGICYLYFGGVQGVTSGVFTCVYSSSGVARFSV